MSGMSKKVGRDSVEPIHERSKASHASISRRPRPTLNAKSPGDARSARAAAGGKQGSTESHPTTLHEDPTPYRVSTPHSEFRVPRFIDLFCGIGGFRIAFERAGGRCVFSSDWDKFSRQTYAANFGETPHGDIHTVAVADIPKFDILCGGFPCQPFSLAGVSKKLSLGRKHGFEDVKQGNLFFTLADIIDYHRPAAFVLENVKHLVRHDQGRTFAIIMDTLENHLGDRKSTRLNSSHG